MAEVVSQAGIPAATDAEARQRSLPTGAVIARSRRLFILVLVAGVAYSALTTASKSFCPGGVESSGGFIDASGNPTTVAPTCVTLTLGPNPLMFVAFAAVIVYALTRALRKAGRETDAVRILDRSAAAIAVVAVVAIVVAQVWFNLIPLTEWTPSGSHTFGYPFPFGTVHLSTSPLTTS